MAEETTQRTLIHMEKMNGGTVFEVRGNRVALAAMFTECLLQDENFSEMVFKGIQAVMQTTGEMLKKKGVLTTKSMEK